MSLITIEFEQRGDREGTVKDNPKNVTTVLTCVCHIRKPRPQGGAFPWADHGCCSVAPQPSALLWRTTSCNR
ncbi:hypothetical protein [Synechococcus sp. UW105]|uniref:hypothetical protein n=1 Tax=unclassified Synechococcus TaxID=2626047 RepID=UPI000E0F1124|nr:hypothetical protein [Synechococcus sp. UW105]